MNNCCDKECNYRVLNGGDEVSDYYWCEYVGISVDRGTDPCLLEKFEREINLQGD